MAVPEVVDIAAELTRVTDLWSLTTVAQLNDYAIELVKMAGEFMWHTHDSDKLFLVIAGELQVQMRDRTVQVGPGQFVVVPRGVEHCPVAIGEVHALLIEPMHQ
ncbi:cupin domain-containing protein [Mycolicibacterium houstonense]|uniref:cupin domain-containing protein n=1 Tax=Mycolicibacterium houstonense TaxID=146021 RepID=UPI00190EF001|nr:cupin domain-containing protein [Mycolicibacterium houstonense]